MTERPARPARRAGGADCGDARRTLVRVAEQIVARVDEDVPAEAAPPDPRFDDDAPEPQEDILTRLAAGGVVATNQALTQRSLEDFLR